MTLNMQIVLSAVLLATLLGAASMAEQSDQRRKTGIVRKGLVLDLDADRGVKVVDGRVSSWHNQADSKAKEFVATRDASHKKGTGHPVLKERVSAIGGHNAVAFKRQEWKL